MAQIFPFRGIFYNLEKIKNLEKVVCPPYDIISPQQQDFFHKLHPFNIIGIDYGKNYPGDSSQNNRYTRAKELFQDWLEKKILVRDKSYSFYLLAQEFTYLKEKFIRWGIIARLKLLENNKVFFHEKTSFSPKEDRFNLIKEVKVNLNPIFTIFEDKEDLFCRLIDIFSSKEPFMQFKFQGVIHRLWRIFEPVLIEEIKKKVSSKDIFIADGHHRYEVSILYQKYCQKKNLTHTGEEDYNFVMVYLTSIKNEALKILPTHRVFKKVPKNLWEKLSLYFEIKASNKKTIIDLLNNLDKNIYLFGMYLGKRRFYLLKLKESLKPEKIIRKNKSNVWKKLDVSIFHSLIIEKVFHIKNSDFATIFYTQDLEEAVRKVESNKYRVAFFLRPTTLNEVKEIALAKERMPHKSTYFYPKLPSGLIINPV